MIIFFYIFETNLIHDIINNCFLTKSENELILWFRNPLIRRRINIFEIRFTPLKCHCQSPQSRTPLLSFSSPLPGIDPNLLLNALYVARPPNEHNSLRNKHNASSERLIRLDTHQFCGWSVANQATNCDAYQSSDWSLILQTSPWMDNEFHHLLDEHKKRRESNETIIY